MLDGLYLNNTWVSAAEELRLTLQANDLQEPAYLQTSYSRAFTLPDTLTVRRLTQGAEATNSASPVPYALLPATVVQSGIVVFTGFARFTEYNATGGWQVTLLDQAKALFSRLDRPLKTIDLSRWAFRWNVAAVRAAAANTDGYCFPLIDYGAVENGGQAADLLLPAVFVKTLLETMLTEEGYSLDWPTSTPYAAFLSALILPLTRPRPVIEVTDGYVADRQARVGMEVRPGGFFVSNGKDFSAPVPFNLVDRPTRGYSQGRLGNYRAEGAAYVADTALRLALELDLTYQLKVMSGGVRITCQLLKNGQTIKEESFQTAGPHNIFLMNYQSFRWSQTVEMNKGDRLTLQITGRQYTWLGGWDFLLDPERSSWTLAPDVSIRTGDLFPLSANLPDLTCLDLLKSVALTCCGTYLADEATRTLRFVPLTPLVKNRAEAVDWSARIDEAADCRYTPRLDPYAQVNTLAYKQKADTEAQGNGTLLVSAPALDEKKLLFTLPFGPVPASKEQIGRINVMPRIELRTIERVPGQPTTITDKEADNGPYWLLVHPTLTQAINTLETIGGTPQPVTVPLRVAWFDARPDTVKQSNSLNVCLSFGDPANGEQGLVTTFFGGLQSILERPRTLELMRVMTPPEIADIRLDRLVYLSLPGIGGLSLPPTYYYINQIDQYAPDLPCRVTLVAAS